MTNKRKAEEDQDLFIALDGEFNSESETSSLFVPNTKLGRPKKVYQVQIESTRSSATRVKVDQQDGYMKNMEDLELQIDMHERIANCIMVSQAPVEIIIGGSHCTSRSFFVHADLLKVLSDFFLGYDFGKQNHKRSSISTLATTNTALLSAEDKPTTTSKFGKLQPMGYLINERKQTRITGKPTSQAPIFVEKVIPETCALTRENEPRQETSLLHTIRPEHFACFLSWATTGKISEDRIVETVNSLNLRSTRIPTLEELCYLGARLRSPGFSNRIIHCLLISKRLREHEWPSVEEVRYIDQRSKRGRPNMKRPLYELAVLAVAIASPLKKHASDHDQHKIWRDLLMEEKSQVVEASLKLDVEKWTRRGASARRVWDDDILVEMWFSRERMLDKVFDKWVQG